MDGPWDEIYEWSFSSEIFASLLDSSSWEEATSRSRKLGWDELASLVSSRFLMIVLMESKDFHGHSSSQNKGTWGIHLRISSPICVYSVSFIFQGDFTVSRGNTCRDPIRICISKNRLSRSSVSFSLISSSERHNFNRTEPCVASCPNFWVHGIGILKIGEGCSICCSFLWLGNLRILTETRFGVFGDGNSKLFVMAHEAIIYKILLILIKNKLPWKLMGVIAQRFRK